MIQRIDGFERKLNYIIQNPVLSLSILASMALFIRLYNFPFNVPLTLDATMYFWYAIDLTILGHFSTDYNFPNNGWPTFLSVFFYLFRSDNFLDYMNLQRILTVIISVLTIIPVYLLCTKFFDRTYSLVGASLFVFEPRIIQNSLFGITEPLSIMLLTTSLCLFLSNNYKSIYFSFGIAALFTLVRYEGILLILPFTIMFFVRFKNYKKNALRYLLALSIFLLVLLPMTYLRIETTGKDGVVSHVSAAPEYYQHIAESGDQGTWNFLNLLLRGLVNLAKYLAWIIIPFFVFFLPYGIFRIFKSRDQKEITIIITAITFLIPAFYGYSRDLQETRYLYALFPIFAIFSGYTVTKLTDRFTRKTITSMLLIGGVLFASLMFLNLKEIDYRYENELFGIAQYLVTNTKGVNDISDISKYYSAAGLINKNFPILRSESIGYEPKIIPENEFTLVEDYIKFGKENGLTHLIVDEKNDVEFFNDVFVNEKNYQYLIKQFDSSDFGFKYHVKIFKINYEIYNSIEMSSKI